MSQDEIIEMAQGCGLVGMRPHLDGIYVESLLAFAKWVEEKALAEHAMQETQRLGQEIEQEPVACKTLCELCVKRGYAFCANAVKTTPIPFPSQPERHELQAKGEHPAPCARHCEANAFQIVIKNLKAQLAQPEQEPVAWLLTDININSLQVDSIQRLIDRLEHAHHTDIRVRINGQDEWFEADWLKHMVRATPPQRTEQELCVHAKNPKGCYRVRCQLGDKCVDDEMSFRTTPPQRKPLHASEIVTMYAERPTSDNDMIEFARAIEAKHDIKE